MVYLTAARRWTHTREGLFLGAAMLLIAWTGPASGTSGNALLALSPAPATGGFDAQAYLQDPFGWPALAAEHPHGWGVAYISESPPPGWSRPFLLRGGGKASIDGSLHPGFGTALDEMLPAHSAAVLTLLSAPDSAACYPGKPNPYPLSRNGWLFVHDGVIDIEGIVLGAWRADWGPEWEAFKSSYPRDYNGNADSTRGNAGEIYFLALMFELSLAPDDVPAAFRRTLLRMSVLPGWEDWQFNAILQNTECTWALRYAPAQAEHYRLFYGLTTSGTYCIVDTLPAAGGEWEEVPNFSLAVLPSEGNVQILPIEFSEAPEHPAGGGRRQADSGQGQGGESALGIWLAVAESPSIGVVRLRYQTPVGSQGFLEIWDLEGRSLARVPVDGGAGSLEWNPMPGTPAGIVLARLRVGALQSRQRVLLLP